MIEKKCQKKWYLVVEGVSIEELQHEDATTTRTRNDEGGDGYFEEARNWSH